MKKTDKNRISILSWIEIAGSCAFLTALSLWICHVMMVSGNGDLRIQFEWAVTGNPKSYSFIDQMYRWIWAIYPEGLGGIAVVTLFVLLGLIFSALFVKELIEHITWGNAFLTALIAWLMIPAYCPAWNPYFVLGVQPAGLWHNPTYIGIKTFLPLAFYFLLRIYREKGQFFVNIIGLAIACTLGTAVKPNYALTFEAMLGIAALFDLLKSRGKHWKNFIGAVIAVIPSAFVILRQYIVNYHGVNEESGITLGVFFIIKHYTEHPVLSILQSMLFAIFALALLRGTLWKEPIYRFAFGMTIIAYAEYLLLVEVGPRMYDANWVWGAALANYGLFLISLPFFFGYTKDAFIKRKKSSIFLSAIGIGIILWHLISTVLYLIQVFRTSLLVI